MPILCLQPLNADGMSLGTPLSHEAANEGRLKTEIAPLETNSYSRKINDVSSQQDADLRTLSGVSS